MTAASSNIGERLTTGYNKHPVTAYLEDGDPLDAGSAIVIASNLNHLAYESCRHIVWDWRSGNAGKPPPGGPKPADYSGYETTDERAPSYVADESNANRISWAIDPGYSTTQGAVARCYAVTLIADAVPDVSTAPTFRWIRCKVRAKSHASNSLSLAVALTPPGVRPSGNLLLAPNPDAVDFWKTVSTTEETVTFTLKPNIAVNSSYAGTPLRCEIEGPNDIIAYAYPALLWFGWEATNETDYWTSFSAFEVRE